MVEEDASELKQQRLPLNRLTAQGVPRGMYNKFRKPSSERGRLFTNERTLIFNHSLMNDSYYLPLSGVYGHAVPKNQTVERV